MRNQIMVLLDKGVEFTFTLPEGEPWASDMARRWLDDQFVALDCEPLRASGKVLTADKVLRVTEAAGAALLGRPEWGDDYAQAVHAALGKPLIRVDVPSMAVTY